MICIKLQELSVTCRQNCSCLGLLVRRSCLRHLPWLT